MASQPKFNSRGQMIEELDDYRSPFVSPVSILGKRKFNDVFEEQTFDDSRYRQHIDTDFFNKNVGHSVTQVSENKVPANKVPVNNIERKEGTKILSYQEELELLNWCDYYRANRNLFNV